ncbi:MAG: YidH family protein [Armatimonadota bacterium]
MSEGHDESSTDDDSSPRTGLARDRTEWAAHRTVLANERTFSAWLRTGLAAVGGGLAVAELLGTGATGWLARVIGILLILGGAGISLLARWRFHQLSTELKARQLHVMPAWIGNLLAFTVVFIALLVLLLLIVR